MTTSHLSTPRVPRGVPTGGEWRSRENPEAIVVLDNARLASRVQHLKSNGYVEPVAVATSLNPASSGGRADWWETSFIAAEYGSSAGDYPQMPDDNTPSQSGGSSLAGRRRTHRMAYSGGGTTLRMPSVAAIKRFASQESGTFDVPVSASTPNGRTVAGWVRVTPGQGGHWDVRSLGMGGETEEYVAEGVRAVLESRRPSRALAQAGDLIERRHARELAAGVKPKPVESTWVRSVGYDEQAKVLVMTTDGHEYGFSADRAKYNAMVEGYSPGRAFNTLVKGQHERVPVERCEKCGRFTANISAHACPITPTQRQESVAYNAVAREAGIRRFRSMANPPAPVPAPSAPRLYGSHVTPPPDHKPVKVAEWMRDATQAAVDNGRYERGPSRYGPAVKRGFTSKVASAIEPYTGTHYTGKEEPGMGTLTFSGMNHTTAQQLLADLPPQAMHDRVNGGPTTANLLSVASRNGGLVELGGEVKAPWLSEEGVNFTEAYLYTDADSPAKAEWQARMLGLASRTRPTVRQVENPWRPGEKTWRLRWV